MLLGIDASRAVTTQRTGTEAYAYYLIRALIEQTRASDIRLRLYFNQPPPANLFSPAPHIEQVVIPFPRLWTHIRLAWELHRRPPDVFFTPAHVLPLTYRGRALATIHDLGYHTFPQAHPWRQRFYLHWSTRHNARRAHHILADSHATKTDLTRFYGTPPEKVTVVYPALPGESGQLAVSSEQLAVSSEQLAVTSDQSSVSSNQSPVSSLSVSQSLNLPFIIHNSQFIIPNSPPYLLYIGTLQPRKNLARLVQAYAQSNVPHHLVLAGRVGWLADDILATIAQQPPEVRERIHLPGYVSDTAKAQLLAQAAGLLYPSLYEGFGFPILEAQQAGIPVLCSNSSSLPEVAGDAALLIDPHDVAGIAAAIHRLTTDEPLRQTLIRKGHDNIKRFTWANAAAQILSIITTI